MIETYAFLAVFAIQLLAMSVLYPAWFSRHVRAQAASIPTERVMEIYPDVDVARVRESILTKYRALNGGIAVLGLVLLGWLFSYMRRPDWDDGPVEALVTAYFMIQTLVPLGLVVWLSVRFNNKYKRSLFEAKRKATLQRRGLFDFVSPFSVVLAALAYLLFAALVMYLRQHPFPGFAGYVVLGAVTLLYALNAFCVYTMLYGKRSNPFEAPADRAHRIAMTVKCCVYSCIACVVFLSLNFTLVLLDWQRWEPFALSVFFVTTALLCSRTLTAPPSQAAS